MHLYVERGEMTIQTMSPEGKLLFKRVTSKEPLCLPYHTFGESQGANMGKANEGRKHFKMVARKSVRKLINNDKGNVNKVPTAKVNKINLQNLGELVQVVEEIVQPIEETTSVIAGKFGANYAGTTADGTAGNASGEATSQGGARNVASRNRVALVDFKSVVYHIMAKLARKF
ncbi:hypothetical protein ACH5RR_003784 [Cinchona calisaya]|uniref:Uncharacterized protein n=1 Tax=Cinchona calisaya TaxID=153742 RepID=A0ABD3AW97_9GENT